MPKKKIDRPPLEKLQRAWEKADDVARSRFVDWLQRDGAIRIPDRAPSGPTLPSQSPPRPLASGRYLTPDTVLRIEATLKERGETLAGLNETLGLPAGDRSLGRAFYRQAPLRLAIIARIEAWLLRQS